MKACSSGVSPAIEIYSFNALGISSILLYYIGRRPADEMFHWQANLLQRRIQRPPHPGEAPAIGTWISTSPKSGAYTFKAIIADPNGKLVFLIKNRGTIQYDSRSDSISFTTYTEFIDLSGKVVMTDTLPFTGTRLVVEAPPK